MAVSSFDPHNNFVEIDRAEIAVPIVWIKRLRQRKQVIILENRVCLG